jgi:hypothetical protein
MADRTLLVIRQSGCALPMRTFRTAYGLARDVVFVLNPRVHACFPDLICGTQRAGFFKSSKLVGAEWPVAVVIARDVPNRIVESRHNALPECTPLLENATSLRQVVMAGKPHAGAQLPYQLPPQALLSQGYRPDAVADRSRRCRQP